MKTKILGTLLACLLQTVFFMAEAATEQTINEIVLQKELKEAIISNPAAIPGLLEKAGERALALVTENFVAAPADELDAKTPLVLAIGEDTTAAFNNLKQIINQQDLASEIFDDILKNVSSRTRSLQLFIYGCPDEKFSDLFAAATRASNFEAARLLLEGMLNFNKNNSEKLSEQLNAALGKCAKIPWYTRFAHRLQGKSYTLFEDMLENANTKPVTE